ncbi:hypothetical protein ATY76_24700 [Rhizobium sp. R339]|uniref:hypothetical protein n=1 Tax=Rhizobium sp. R339 TaxID=1764273 RepID=UPI000B63F4AB|nr:hypothetical protein [Rhizobium sp. R339]OWV75010.1 hypothetical protein ATY76_24700 [Rhizobium sp. R339]
MSKRSVFFAILLIVLVVGNASAADENMGVSDAIKKLSLARDAFFRCAAAIKILNNIDHPACRTSALTIILAQGQARLPQIEISDSTAVRSIVEDVISDKSPLRFERPAKPHIDSMVEDVSSSLKRSGPDYDMIDCLAELEYFQRANTAACNYAYAKVELILSKIADVVGWGVTRDEFPYVLQRGLEAAYRTGVEEGAN